MNFKLKALVVAAVATMTMSGAASAIGVNDTFLVAYNAATDTTFTASLGSTAPSAGFTSTNQSFNFGADTNWTNFYNSVGVDKSGIKYQVLSHSSSNPFKLWTTSNDITSAGANGQLQNAVSQFTGALGVFNQFLVIGNPGATNFVPSTASFGQGDNIGNQIGAIYSGFTTDASINSNLSFHQITLGTLGRNPTPPTLTSFQLSDASGPAFWNLSNTGTLTYTAQVAAIPEADTAAMMLMGLGFMGFVARRRSAK